MGIAGAIGVSAAQAADPTPAGIVIESTAQASYDDGGITRNVTSNTVQVRVDELLDPVATALDAGSLEVRPGPAVLSFLVSNAGNGPEAFNLQVVTSVAGNAFDTTLDSIAVDTNSNATYDPGIDQTLSAPAVTEILAPGASLTIFVILSVPDGIEDGAQSEVSFVARAATGNGAPGNVFAGAGENGSDAIAGLSGGEATAIGQMVATTSIVALQKSGTVADPFGGSAAVPGATITYNIAASVTGSAQIDDLVITDQIPPGTQYVAGSLALDGTPLSDVADSDAGEATPDAITVNLGTVASGSSNIITFAVLIAE
jgi:uncharacterized repeat protein (TIGR01451 family)